MFELEVKAEKLLLAETFSAPLLNSWDLLFGPAQRDKRKDKIMLFFLLINSMKFSL